MSEPDFERRLERLFLDAPEFADSAAFASRVERKLEVAWSARRWLIGVAGVVGGVVGVSQLLASNLMAQMETASQGSARILSGLNHLAPQLEWFAAAPSGAVVWPAAALAVVAAGFVLSRVIEEI